MQKRLYIASCDTTPLSPDYGRIVSILSFRGHFGCMVDVQLRRYIEMKDEKMSFYIVEKYPQYYAVATSLIKSHIGWIFVPQSGLVLRQKVATNPAFGGSYPIFDLVFSRPIFRERIFIVLESSNQL